MTSAKGGSGWDQNRARGKTSASRPICPSLEPYQPSEARRLRPATIEAALEVTGVDSPRIVDRKPPPQRCRGGAPLRPRRVRSG